MKHQEQSHIQLLDCTLRDGAYIVDGQFGVPAMKGILKKLAQARVDIIECGWLKDAPHTKGSSFFHVPEDLLYYLDEKKPGAIYTAMIDYNRYDDSVLPAYDGRSIDAIRVVFPRGQHEAGIAIGERIRQKGYQVFYQAANTLAYTDEELCELAAAMNEVHAASVSIVDTFGAMYEEDLIHIADLLHEQLEPMTMLGFHSHNNQQLSYALTMAFVRAFRHRKRQVLVDASLCGMGRGAGNATTELVVNYLNSREHANYDMDAIMDAIDVYMEPFASQYEWGYSTPYMIAGMYCCHVNNIAYLRQNHRTNARDMRNIIESLPPQSRIGYDYDLLESHYLANESRLVDDEQTVTSLRAALSSREILLLAPGQSILTHQAKIKDYIATHQPIVIGVNAMIADYTYDYLFLMNSARYDYASSTHGARFMETKRILSSGIKTNPDANEWIINFNSLIKRGWVHYDNAVICALRLLERLGIDEVALAGFDGFAHQYNESYADPSLPTLNPEGHWDELNEEIREIFKDFIASAKYCKNLHFLTESIFND